MTPTTILLIHCAAIPCVVYIVAVLTYLHTERSMAAAHRKQTQFLLNAVKPAIRHNRSWPAIEYAAEAIRTYEEANRQEQPAANE